MEYALVVLAVLLVWAIFGGPGGGKRVAIR
jgi:hypothetical protein